MRLFSAFLAVLVTACAAGCAGGRYTIGGGSVRPVKAAPAAASASPGAPDAAAGKESEAIRAALAQVRAGRMAYTISAADLLEITVFQEKDLERKVRVSPDGTITLPLIGEVKLAGLGVAEAERLLVERYRKYVIEPHVSIFIKEYGNKLVYVLGEVQKPGSYPLPTEAPLSVLEAVTLAGGFTQYAWLDRTRVVRGGDNGASIVVEISAITKRGDKSKDVVLQPNDVIVVPERMF